MPYDYFLKQFCSRLIESCQTYRKIYTKRSFRNGKILILTITISTVFWIILYSFKIFSGNNIFIKLFVNSPPPPPILDPSRHTLPVSHVFIVSAYYYPYSESLGRNAVALNMIVDSKNFPVENVVYSVIGSNATHRQFLRAESQVEGVSSCRYITVMAKTTAVENLSKFEMEISGATIEIPFKMAHYTAPKPVIICISPQFVAEQWQTFLMHVHVAHQFGGHLHIYLTSIIESFFNLMREYEKRKYLTLDFWLRMKFTVTKTPFYEPNSHVEWRNQAGAQTDCLLKYKEAAEFIAFFDMDDILFPKSYPTYLEEFRAEWEIDPTSNSIFYGRREHEFVKAKSFSAFNFKQVISSLGSSEIIKRGKVVVKPERYNSTWIHYSWHDQNRREVKSPNLVHVQRPLEEDSDNEMTDVWQIDFGALNETIRLSDIEAIDRNIAKIKNSSRIMKIASQLPTTDFYFPIVFDCYYKAFYGAAFDGQKGGFGCPNADTCELPQREEHKCVHSDAEYSSGPHMIPFTYHFFNNSFWNWNIGCYQ